MKKHKLILTALAITVAIGLTACESKKAVVQPSNDTPTSTVQEKPITIDLKDVEKDLKAQVKQDAQSQGIREFDIDIEDYGNVEIDIEVERGTPEGDAENLARKIYKQYNELIKKYNPEMKEDYPLTIQIEEDQTDLTLYQAVLK